MLFDFIDDYYAIYFKYCHIWHNFWVEWLIRFFSNIDSLVSILILTPINLNEKWTKRILMTSVLTQTIFVIGHDVYIRKGKFFFKLNRGRRELWARKVEGLSSGRIGFKPHSYEPEKTSHLSRCDLSADEKIFSSDSKRGWDFYRRKNK